MRPTTAMHNSDYKFIAIPLVFILLRVWSQTIDVIFFYMGRESIPGPQGVAIALLYLAVRGSTYVPCTVVKSCNCLTYERRYLTIILLVS